MVCPLGYNGKGLPTYCIYVNIHYTLSCLVSFFPTHNIIEIFREREREIYFFNTPENRAAKFVYESSCGDLPKESKS